MASENSIWKFVKSERLVIVWWTIQFVGLLLIFGFRYPGVLLVNLWLAVSIACYALDTRNVKKLGAISLAFYAFFTLIVAGVIVYYFVYDGGVNSEVVFHTSNIVYNPIEFVDGIQSYQDIGKKG